MATCYLSIYDNVFAFDTFDYKKTTSFQHNPLLITSCTFSQTRTNAYEAGPAGTAAPGGGAVPLGKLFMRRFLYLSACCHWQDGREETHIMVRLKKETMSIKAQLGTKLKIQMA